MHYIGLDVHTSISMFCIFNEFGKIVKEGVIRGPMREVVRVMTHYRKSLGGPVHLCYEASGGCGWLYDQLTAAGLKIQVAHPGKVRLIFRTKRKNDRIDARKLATLLFLDQVPLAHVPKAEVRQWRSLIEYRSKLVSQRGAAKNRLRALLRANGIVAPRSLWTARGLAWLAEQPLSEFESLQRDLLLTELDEIQARIRRVEAALKTWAAKTPAVGLLMTIPGVGIRTAEAVVAYMDDPNRFRRNKSVGCYFGMVPCEDTSVKTRFGHITKEGPSLVRRLITEATWQAIRRDDDVRAYYERIHKNDPKRRKTALIATAHHLLRAMHAMLVNGEEWRSAA